MPKNNHKHTSPQSLNGYIKSICDIMRRSNCAGALQYVPELTWILFLRILDEREMRETEEAEAAISEASRSAFSSFPFIVGYHIVHYLIEGQQFPFQPVQVIDPAIIMEKAGFQPVA